MTALCYSPEMERGRQEDWSLKTSGTRVRVRRARHSSHIQNETQLCHLDRYYFVFFNFWPRREAHPDVGKERGQEEKRVTEDAMVGWHHRLNGQEFEQTPGDGERQPGVLQSMGSQSWT